MLISLQLTLSEVLPNEKEGVIEGETLSSPRITLEYITPSPGNSRLGNQVALLSGLPSSAHTALKEGDTWSASVSSEDELASKRRRSKTRGAKGVVTASRASRFSLWMTSMHEMFEPRG